MLSPSLHSPHQVVAIDLDEGPNGQVTYRMQVGMPRMDFLINSTSGLITSTTMLDRERIAEYYLRVVASDAGVPSKSSTSTLTVKGGCTRTAPRPAQPESPSSPKKMGDKDMSPRGRCGLYRRHTDTLIMWSVFNSSMHFYLLVSHKPSAEDNILWK